MKILRPLRLAYPIIEASFTGKDRSYPIIEALPAKIVLLPLAFAGGKAGTLLQYPIR